ncbi:MAG: ATP-dependent DNA helicase [Actinobacteria bacterium]|nr:ATP-dependent DNA helicase [Actinomycetota bacterium]
MPEAVALDAALAAVVESIGGQQRDGQLQMAEAVAAALSGSGHAIVQAGTGTGKSVGYLVPAALHAVAPEGGAVIVATATIALQKQLVDRDLPRVAEALGPMIGRPLTYAVLKGRNNYVCLQKLHGSVPDDDAVALFDAPKSALGQQAVAVRAWAEDTSTGDRDEYPDDIDPRVWRGFSVGRRECMGEARCPFGEECFTVKRRQLAQESDIVVTNHAMLAIDAIEGIPVLPEHDAVIIDEGHELVDRATQAITGELSAAMLERAISRSRRMLDPESAERLQRAADELDDCLRIMAADMGGPSRLEVLPRDLVLALTLVRDACHQAMAEVNADKDGKDADALAARQQARGALEEVHDVAGNLLAMGERDVVWVDPGESRAPLLKVAPLSVSGLLRASLFDRTPVAMTSATLTVGGGFDALLMSLGLAQDETVTIDVGSPFDHARQGILYVARDIPAPGRDGIAMEALDELADLIEAAGGRTLALFSSWRGVERAAEYLRVRLGSQPGLPILVQRRGDAVGSLVQRFADEPASTLLGTVSLWQGVDVPGESCIQVVIDRIPFPRPDDPLLSARQKAVDEAGGSGFRAVSVPRAGLLLAQGAGRLIRGVDDRGVVAVLDSRLATAGYARALRASLPPFWYTTDRATVIGALERLRDGASVPSTTPAP